MTPDAENTPQPDQPHDTTTEHVPTDAATPATLEPRPAGSEPVTRPSGPVPVKRTRTSGIWVAVIVAVVVLIFLLIFIVQNLASATVHYLGAAGTLPLGVALLFAAVGGALLVALVGAARILQLRRHATKRVTARPAALRLPPQ